MLLGDDIVRSKVPCTKQLMNVFEKYGSPVIGVEYTTKHRKYGMIKPEKVDERLYRIKEIVEKPKTWKDPNNLGVIGRYVMTPDVFECIEETKPGYGGEIQFTDAIRKLGERRQIYAYEFEGKRYDVGDQLGIVKATTEFALDRKDISKDTKLWIKNLAKEL